MTPGSSDLPDRARAQRRSLPGRRPAAAAPTRYGGWKYAHAESTSPAAHGPRCGQWEGRLRSGVWGRWLTSVRLRGFASPLDNNRIRKLFSRLGLRSLVGFFSKQVRKEVEIRILIRQRVASDVASSFWIGDDKKALLDPCL